MGLLANLFGGGGNSFIRAEAYRNRTDFLSRDHETISLNDIYDAMLIAVAYWGEDPISRKRIKLDALNGYTGDAVQFELWCYLYSCIGSYCASRNPELSREPCYKLRIHLFKSFLELCNSGFKCDVRQLLLDRMEGYQKLDINGENAEESIQIIELLALAKNAAVPGSYDFDNPKLLIPGLGIIESNVLKAEFVRWAEGYVPGLIKAVGRHLGD